VVGDKIAAPARRRSYRSGGAKAPWSKMPRWLVTTLGLGSALLIAMTAGTAGAQDITGSWQKVRQACHTNQLTCGIKAKLVVSNIDNINGAAASSVAIYLSDDAIFDAASDTLLTTIAVGPLAAEETTSVKTSFQLALGISASASFIIAVTDSAGSVGEIDETNNVAVFANPGPTGIVIFDKLFGPNAVTFPVGTRVRWMHRDDGTDHTVTSGSTPRW
jgi:hypothetical protein